MKSNEQNEEQIKNNLYSIKVFKKINELLEEKQKEKKNQEADTALSEKEIEQVIGSIKDLSEKNMAKNYFDEYKKGKNWSITFEQMISEEIKGLQHDNLLIELGIKEKNQQTFDQIFKSSYQSANDSFIDLAKKDPNILNDVKSAIDKKILEIENSESFKEKTENDPLSKQRVREIQDLKVFASYFDKEKGFFANAKQEQQVKILERFSKQNIMFAEIIGESVNMSLSENLEKVTGFKDIKSNILTSLRHKIKNDVEEKYNNLSGLVKFKYNIKAFFSNKSPTEEFAKDIIRLQSTKNYILNDNQRKIKQFSSEIMAKVFDPIKKSIKNLSHEDVKKVDADVAKKMQEAAQEIKSHPQSMGIKIAGKEATETPKALESKSTGQSVRR